MMKCCVLLCVLALSLSCSRAGRMGFPGTNPPRFELGGGERLYRLTFYKKSGGGGKTDSYCVVWRVVAERGEPKSFGEMKEITYGVVPAGYAQEFPSPDAAPEALAPGASYEYHFETDAVPNYPREFVIKDGGAQHTLME